MVLVAVDTNQAIITAIYTILTGDTGTGSLTAIMGTVRLHLVMAQEDAPMPYLVHSLSIDEGGTLSLRSAVYKIDLWNYSPTATKIFEMRDRIIYLLDEQRLAPPDGEFGAARMVLTIDEPMETDADDVWRYHLRFDMKYERVREILAVIGR